MEYMSVLVVRPQFYLRDPAHIFSCVILPPRREIITPWFFSSHLHRLLPDLAFRSGISVRTLALGLTEPSSVFVFRFLLSRSSLPSLLSILTAATAHSAWTGRHLR